MTASEDRLWFRAQRYIAARQTTAARITLEALIQRVPDHIQGRVLLAGAILSEEGRLRVAAAHLLEAAKSLPNDADSIAMIALALLRVGEIVAARTCLDHPEVQRTTSVETLMSLAHVCQLLGEHETSLALMDRARALGFDNPDFRYFRGVQLQFNGRIREAEAEMEACLRMGPTFGRASFTLARLRRQTANANHLSYIREQLQRVPRDTEDHAAFEFAQFKELDDLGEYEQAWAALERGNASVYRRLQPDSAREGALFDALIERCTVDFLRSTQTEFTGPIPIFVIGMPRSGTTILERLLGNHSMVTSVGELSDFSRQLQWQADYLSGALIDKTLASRAVDLDYASIGQRYLWQTQWRAKGKAFYVDKLPPNYLLAGFIHRALPHAPILHIVRDPMDTCFSNYKAFFGDAYPYSYNLTTLATHYQQYRRLMQHWHAVMPGRILDVSYATLVKDPETVARDVFAFCGLQDEPGCIDLTRNSAPVATMSSVQVREPIHARSLGEWRRYEQQLDPLRVALGY